MGCGRVGSTLAKALSDMDHDVAVIDSEPAAFRRLGSNFDGRTVTGLGFDRDTLTAAGVAGAYAFAAVSSGDNSNILAARVARETFGVENVVARIYDPGRAMVYQRLGIPTVATVRWTADQIMHRLMPEGSVPEFTDPSGMVVIAEIPLQPAWIGHTFASIEDATGARIAYVSRLGEGLVPNRSTVYQDGDLVHVATTRAQIDVIEAAFQTRPVAE